MKPPFTKTLFACLLLGLATNCQSPQKSASNDYQGMYFDLKGAIGQLSATLQTTDPSVNKAVSVNEQEETKTCKIENWEKELELFKNADLNQPTLEGTYETLEASENGLQQITYTAKSGTSPKVKKLIIWKKGGQLVKMEAITQEENMLFEAAQNLQLELKAGKLQRYAITASQAITWGNETSYSAAGKLIDP